MSCSVVSCSSRTTNGGVKNPELSFHTFPKCPERKGEWIKAVRRYNWEPNKYSRLCSKHFDESCFVPDLARKVLKSDAVPTIFEGYPVYYQPVAKKKRKPPQCRDEIQYITINPERLEERDVKTEDTFKTPMRVVSVLKSLAKSRTMAKKRLGTIKAFRERNRKLLRKNATLIHIIRYLRNKKLIDIN